ncbi:PAS domain-containing protein [Streptomyces sp. NPDC052036]|uniref:PAS domain-containing protein n=1 Tax=Streptomyces sp. NPDC052036 TaxID=3155171 RepID=UPI0034252E4A
MAVVDADRVLTYWSPGAVRLLGCRPHEVVGRSAADLLAVDLPKAALRSIGRQQEWRGRGALRHQDGHTVEVGFHASPALGMRHAWAGLGCRGRRAQPSRGSDGRPEGNGI